jgi:hypothetical protein
VHDHRARPGSIGPVSGFLEDAESGPTEAFHSFNEVQILPEDSIARDQPGFPDPLPQEIDTYDKVTVTG